MIILKYLFQAVLSFIAAGGFSLVFNAPRKELVYCGISGVISWMLYYSLREIMGASAVTIPVLFAAIGATTFSRGMSFRRRMPITVYLVGGILPLVPGVGIYSTMSLVLEENTTGALIKGIETLKTSGVIAIGIMTVLSLPAALFIDKSAKPSSENNKR